MDKSPAKTSSNNYSLTASKQTSHAAIIRITFKGITSLLKELTVLASSKISLLLVKVYTSLATVDRNVVDDAPGDEGANAEAPERARKASVSFMVNVFLCFLEMKTNDFSDVVWW